MQKRAKDETDSRISQISREELRRRTFQRALKLLSLKPRSVSELREQLQKGRATNNTVVEAVISRLQEYGYLDDERYAFGYASAKVRRRPLGRQRLKRELVLKKIDQEVADETLNVVFAETPEEELIDRAIAKRIRLRGSPITRDEARKLFEHLLRQGFPIDLVSEKVRDVAKIDSEDPTRD